MNRNAGRIRKMGPTTGIAVAAVLTLLVLRVNAQEKQPEGKAASATTKPATAAELKMAARALTDKGKYSEAMAVIEQVLKLDPSDEYAIGVMPLLADKAEIEAQRKAQRNLVVVDGKRDIPPKEQLERLLPGLNFEGVALADIIEFLRDVVGSESLSVDWASLKSAGVEKVTPINLKFRNVKFGKALDLILANATAAAKVPFKLSYSVDANKILIFASDKATPKPDEKTVQRIDSKTPATKPSSMPGGNR